jgi:alcohol dehydrogenase class IV
MDVMLFEGVEPNPTVKTVESGVMKALGTGCDMVVAIGGGSAIDAAKLMAVGVGHENDDVWPYVTCEKETTQKTLPVIAIPSTSGTGTHVTWYTVITNSETEEKAAYSSRYIYPRESIVDVNIMSKMPKKVTAETGFDALAHVMEAYVSKKASPLTDALSLRAIESIGQNLVRAYGVADADSRHAMALADTIAGICITASRTIMVHGVGNTLSGFYPNIAHGQALASLTPPVMRYNIGKGDQKTVSKYCNIARSLGEDISHNDKENALKSIGAVEGILEKIGLRRNLSELGVREDRLQEITEAALELGGGAIACNPVQPSNEDVLKIYREAL